MGQFSATRRAPAKGRGKGRGFRRPGKRQALNRAYQYLELVPKGRDEEAFKSPMEWVRRHDEYAAAGSLLPRWIKVVENAKVALNLLVRCIRDRSRRKRASGGDPAAIGEQTAGQS